MFKILRKELLAPATHLIVINAPAIADKAHPGQFVIVRIDKKGERIPITIYDYSQNDGTVSMVFQEVGKTTAQMGALKEGDDILDTLGPLGEPTHIEHFGRCIAVGGGVGIASVFPLVRALKEAGNEVVSIIGARCKEVLILEDQIKRYSDKIFVSTDDGSYGQKGFVTDVLKNLLNEGPKPDRVFAIGPLVMMKAVSQLTRPLSIKTIVSLNPIMVDGTGMCGSCRATVGGERVFACVDGPDFDAKDVDFDELIQRNKRYLNEETQSFEKFRLICKKGHRHG